MTIMRFVITCNHSYSVAFHRKLIN